MREAVRTHLKRRALGADEAFTREGDGERRAAEHDQVVAAVAVSEAVAVLRVVQHLDAHASTTDSVYLHAPAQGRDAGFVVQRARHHALLRRVAGAIRVQEAHSVGEARHRAKRRAVAAHQAVHVGAVEVAVAIVVEPVAADFRRRRTGVHVGASVGRALVMTTAGGQQAREQEQ